jgi:hypothetical protein
MQDASLQIIPKERDQNLMVVAAVEGYAFNHHMDARSVLALFLRNKVNELIRSQYDVLHTQALDESIAFAEDILARASRGSADSL